MNVLGAALLVIPWCLMGFIAMGVLSALWVESYYFPYWQKAKYGYRIYAIVFGPFLFLVVLTYMLFVITIVKFRDRKSIWTLPDWILAGFTDPPTKPKEETVSDFPTVSP